jgi:hypothetical protein
MKQKTWIVVGAVLLIALLAGAAYIVPGLMSGRFSGILAAIPGFAEGTGRKSLDITLIPAPELPQHPPDMVGSVARTSNNSIFVTPRNGGTELEVVVTKDTHIWQDDNQAISTTVQSTAAKTAGSALRVQETVVAITVAQVMDNDDILLWGEQRGDRFIASTVLLRGMVNTKGGTPMPGGKK